MTRPLRSWDQSVSHLAVSPHDFFAALKELLNARNIGKIHFSIVRHGEGRKGKRDYLCISHHRTEIHVGAAPHGTGLYLTYWVFRGEPRSILGQIFGTFASLSARIPIPFLAPGLVYFFNQLGKSFETKVDVVYATDSAFMFQSTVHQCIQQIIIQTGTSQGSREEFLAQPTTFSESVA